MDEVLVRDVYPAEVYEVGAKVMTGVRVFITDRRMIVWRVDGAKNLGIGLEITLAEPGSIAPSRNPLGATEMIEVASMTQGFIVNRGRGCGCGSKLQAVGRPAPWDGRA